MPTNDAPAPPPRRRSLGRGPGAAPAAEPRAAEPRAAEPRAAGSAETEPRTGPSPVPPSAEPGDPEVAAPVSRPAPPGVAAVPDPAHAPEGEAYPVPPAGEPAPSPGPGDATARDPAPARPEPEPDAAHAPEAESYPGPLAGGSAAEPAPGTAARGAEAAVNGSGVAAGGGWPEPDPAHGRAEEGADGPVRPSADVGEARGGGAAAEAVSGPSADSDDHPDAADKGDDGTRFILRLDNFEGPFDLLLQLISKHKLDVTEVALSRVTDDFMAYIRAMGPDWDLDQTTEFLVVAATLLDLKAARLLPAAEVEDEADLALLEARDLLFARLLQYRAYKRIADIFHDRLVGEAARHPRTVGLEPHHAELLPDVVISIGAEGFARLAVKAMQPRPKPQVYVDHIHAPLVSVREQAGLVVARLRELGEASFRTLAEDAPDVLTVVARFLALLELYRERAVLLDQPEALGELMVRWTGAEGEQPLVTDEFDQEAGAQRKRVEEQTGHPADERAEEKEKQEVRS
ncbi:segregation/condensation protein A [Streptomyces sp. NPDC048636]|uniref:segregation/condensation protein A n=1 Tax=Streptomyces sp. NPDC048636 TaxID=3155762 RepID=UPI003424F2CC